MVYYYKELVENGLSRYQIERRVTDKKLYKIETGIYSDEEFPSELAVIAKKYPKAILTLNSAFFYYGLTDKIPDYYYLATDKKARKIGMITDTNYNYVIHEKSETTTMNERVFDILNVMKKVNKDIDKKEFYKELEFLNIRTLFRYTLQQKNQNDKKLANKFIDEVFTFLNSEFPDWKHNEIWKKRSFLKRVIEGNKTLTKIYCKVF